LRIISQETFNRTGLRSPGLIMSDFLTRIVEEQVLLKEKYLKLWNFLGSEQYEKLDSYNKNLLQIQYSAMETYLKVLDMRIEHLSPKEEI